jgi:hypothetical protein
VSRLPARHRPQQEPRRQSPAHCIATRPTPILPDKFAEVAPGTPDHGATGDQKDAPLLRLLTLLTGPHNAFPAPQTRPHTRSPQETRQGSKAAHVSLRIIPIRLRLLVTSFRD